MTSADEFDFDPVALKAKYDEERDKRRAMRPEGLAQYRELAAFAQFGSDLDPATQKQLNRGSRLVEILKQPQFQPLTAAQQVSIVFAGTKGLLDDIDVKQVQAFEHGFHEYMGSTGKKILDDIMSKKALDDDISKRLTDAINDYKGAFKAGQNENKPVMVTA